MVTVDGQIICTCSGNGATILDNSADQNDQFEITESLNLTLQSVSPLQVSENQTTIFTATLQNDGLYDVLLNTASTYLEIGGSTGQIVPLSANQVIPGGPGAVVELIFSEGAVTLPASLTPYPVRFVFGGTENGNAVGDTIIAADNILVQTAASLQLVSLNLSDTQVSQGESGQTLTVALTNNGQAAARIDQLSDIAIQYSSAYSLSLGSGQVFPLTIGGGSGTSLIYNLTVADQAAGGNDTFTATVAYRDANSESVTNLINPAVNDSWTVLLSANLQVTALSAAADSVTAGQSALSVSLTIRNSGQVDAQIGTADSLGLVFERNVNSQSTSQVFPFTVPAGGQQTIPFLVDIQSSAATGMDSIAGFVLGKNLRSGKISGGTSAYLDAWQVFQPARLVLNSVRSSYSRVNRNQQNVPVEIRITNEGQAEALLDSVRLYITGAFAGSFTRDTLETTLSNLPGGGVQTLNFNSDILATAPDSLHIDARYKARDKISLVSLADTGAVAADYWLIGDPANLAIDSVVATVDSLSQGQTGVEARVFVRNTGTSEIQIDALRLKFNNQPAHSTLAASRTQPATLPLLPSGGSFSAVFSILSSTTPRDSGLVILDAEVEGTDILTGNSGSDLNAAQTAALHLQTPANPQVIAIANAASVSRGQTDIPVSLTLRNKGTAFTLINDVILEFQNGNTYYNREYLTPVKPFLLRGWSDTTVVYAVDIIDDPATPLGMDHLRATTRAVDANSAKMLSHTSDYLSQWNVFGTGGLSIISVASPRDSVSTGHQNIPVDVLVQNGGENPVRVDSLRLSISRGSFDPASLVIYPAVQINPSSQASFRLFVDILPTSATGVATLNARADGQDVNTLELISDPDAESGDSWLIQRAVAISATDNSPGQISSGQNIAPQATVSNSGEADLLLDPALTRLESVADPGFFRMLSAEQFIPGKGTAVLNFESGTATFSSGDYPLRLNLQGTENDTVFNALVAVPNNLVIVQPAQLAVDSVPFAATNISRNTDTSAVVVLTNAGEAGLVVDSLVLMPYGVPTQISPALPFTLSGGSRTSFSVQFTIPADADTGTVVLNAAAGGNDENSAARLTDNGADVTAAINVFTPSAATVLAVTSTETSVAPGQTNIPVQVRLKNTGGAILTINSLTLQQKIGLYQFAYPALPVTIPSFGETVLTVMTTVYNNTATGTDSLYAQVGYTDPYSGKTGIYNSTVFVEWEISGRAVMQVISVSASRDAVSVGQTGLNVRIRVRNSGAGEARVTALNPVFTENPANYVLGSAQPALPLTLSSGQEQTFSFSTQVDGAAVAGPDTVYASGSAVESVGDLVFSLTDPTVYDDWQVQLRPALVIDSVRTAPVVVSTGQSALISSVYVTNTTAPYRSAALIDSVFSQYFAGVNEMTGQFGITRKNTPTLPLRLESGAQTRFDFTVNTLTAPAGNYSNDARLVWRDANDLQVSASSGSSDTGALLIEPAAALTISQVWMTPDTISQGQTHGRVHLLVRNSGGATAELEQSSVSFSPALSFNPILQPPGLPVILPTAVSDTLIYAVTIPAGYNGPVLVSAAVSGVDLHDNRPLSASASDAAEFEIQTPAAVAYISGSTIPASAASDTTVAFELELTNLGQAAVLLDSNLTTLNLSGLSYTIALSGQSEQVIRPFPATTRLRFRPTALSGSSGEYPLLLNLNGSTNQAAYSKSLEAGVFAFGDSLVSITSIELVDGNPYVQGQTALEVLMTISNTGVALPIDGGLDETTLFFRDASGSSRDGYILNLTRMDHLDTLRTQDNNQLRFRFDLSANFPTSGNTRIFGQISLDNNNIIRQSAFYTELIVQTAANALYVEGSVAPDTLVSNQKTAFSLSFADTGTASLNLDPDSTYLRISGIAAGDIMLSGHFSISGKDTATLIFDEVQIPAGLSPGLYDLQWFVKGYLANGRVYRNSGTAVDALRVVPSANLIFESIVIAEEVVRQGQSGVEVTYRIRNDGISPAVINGLQRRFTNMTSSADASSEWLLAGDPTAFPDTLGGGQTLSYNFTYNISETASEGQHQAAPFVNYFDRRVPAIGQSSSVVESNDLVSVIRPGRVRIDSLVAVSQAATPNLPRVNTDQPFDLRVKINNTGSDNLSRVYVSLRHEGSLLQTHQFSNVAAFSQAEFIFPHSGWPFAEAVQFTARIDSAFDSINRAVGIDPGADVSEQISVEQPARLSLSSAISSPSGSVDGTVSAGGSFTVRTTVGRSGTAAVGSGQVTMQIPANFEMLSAVTVDYVESQPVLQWQVRALSLSSAAADTLRLVFSTVPQDKNSGLPVLLDAASDSVLVRVVPAAVVSPAISITAPAGALDKIISTAQTFTLQADIQFNSSVADTGRSARLILPAGYSAKSPTTRQLSDGTGTATAVWEVVAPEEKPLTVDSFYVEVEAADRNNGLAVSGQSARFGLTVVDAPKLTLSLDIIEPQGALDDTVSYGQTLKLLARVVQSSGEAAVTGSGDMTLTIPEGFELVEGVDATAELNKTFSESEDIFWYVRVKEAAAGITARAELGLLRSKDKEHVADSAPAESTDQVRRLLQKIAKAGQENQSLRVAINSRPLDENSAVQAAIGNPLLVKPLYMEDAATLAVSAITRHSNVSTSQTIPYALQVTRRGSVENARAFMVLSADLNQAYVETFGAEPGSRPVGADNRVNFQLTIPDSYKGDGSEEVTFYLEGSDANTGELTAISVEVLDSLNILKRPVLAFGTPQMTPVSALNGVVSHGQLITVEIPVGYAGKTEAFDYAGLSGTGSVQLDPEIVSSHGFILGAGETFEKTFSAVGQTVSWQLTAPSADKTVAMKFNYKNLPLDAVSGLAARVDVEQGSLSLPLTVFQKIVTVTVLDSLFDQHSFTRNSANVPLMAFSVSNKGYSVPLNMSGMEIEFFTAGSEGTESETLDETLVRDLFSNLRVMNYEQYRNDPGGTVIEGLNEPVVLANITMASVSQANPLEIEFDLTGTIAADLTDTLVLVANFNSSAPSRAFRTALNNLNAWDVDAGSPLAIRDSRGVEISRSQEFTTPSISIIPDNPKNAFGNYPNPFGQNYPFTNIVFYLEADADIDVRIFTLLGELVWEYKETGLTAGIYDTHVRWDGRNGNGHVVLNGVYLCTIDIRPVGGGSGQHYITKIAYIK